MPKLFNLRGLGAAAALTGAIVLGAGSPAQAFVAAPKQAFIAGAGSGATKVRWVCGPYRCAWIPGYRGEVVVRPYMRRWVKPPNPHCYYKRTLLFAWKLVCP